MIPAGAPELTLDLPGLGKIELFTRADDGVVSVTLALTNGFTRFNRTVPVKPDAAESFGALLMAQADLARRLRG